MFAWPVKLRALSKAGLPTRGAILIGLVAVSVAVPAFALLHLSAAQAAARHQEQVQLLLTLALAAHLETDPDPAPQQDEWLNKLAEESRRVHWAGIFAPDGSGIEFRRRTSLRRECIVSQIDFSDASPRTRPLQIDGTDSPRFDLMTIPRGADGRVMAAVLDRGTSGPRGGTVAGIWLAAAAILGLALSAAWLHFAIVRPMQQLSRSVSGVRAGLAEIAASGTLPADLGRVLRSVELLQSELERWRGEATQLRHSVETRVDARTRLVALEARNAEREADTDALTRLGSRRAFERELPALFEQQRLNGRELVLMLVDIDNFKLLNDALGHQAGDRLLAFIGHLIRGTAHVGVNRAMRYGGDEFALLLPDETATVAAELGKQLVALFAQRVRSLDGDERRPALSVGIATLREHGAESCEELIRLADEAMYWAKRTGCRVATVDQVRHPRHPGLTPPPAGPRPL